ncbi:MAG: hypothetical protein M0P95_13235 [Sulfuritalea sp.]|nr:hypothetical protein [Sulfuritalea sp.]
MTLNIHSQQTKPMWANPAVDLVRFALWTLRDEAAPVTLNVGHLLPSSYAPEGGSMALHRVTGEDLRKIHGEVAQLINQRFLVTTLSITLFGVVTAWVLSKVPSTAGQPVGGLVYALSILHIALLLVLFGLQHSLKRMLRMFSTYLVVTEASEWEQDWKTFRAEMNYFGYSKPIAFVYLFMSLVVCVLPLGLVEFYGLTYAPFSGLITLTVVSVVAVVIVALLGLGGVADHEKDAERKWKELKNGAQPIIPPDAAR